MISVFEGTMAMFNDFLTIALASISLPLAIVILFRYAMKEKTYDERIAEQRKELLEHSMKSKSKNQPVKKSAKKVEKERSHSDNKKKFVPPTKDVKKSDVVTRNNPVTTSTDKADGISSVSKKKTEKIHSKNSNSNLSLKSASDDVDEKQRTSNDDNNNQEKFTGDVIESDANDESTAGSTTVVSTAENDVPSGSISNQLENDAADNVCYAGINNEREAINVCEKSNAKSKLPARNPAVEGSNSDLLDRKSSQLEQATKKQNTKQDTDAAPNKSSQKGEEKSKDNKASKNKSEDKEKVDGEKYSKDYGKLSASPSKDKRSCESIASKNSETGSDSGSFVGNGVDEMKEIQEIKKDFKALYTSDVLSVNEEGNSKLEKSPSSANSKKSNATGSGANSGGKTSPVQGAKNQRQANNTKNVKKQTTEIKVLQKISNENNGPMNVTLLIPLLAKAELSRSEIQNLIDLLLNKQQDSTIDAEWIGSGRQDPMVKLKKQLAEKEKVLTAEQEAHQALQSKLKELRAELNSEKHSGRQREETLTSRQADMQALNARLQVLSEEKQNLVKQMQQLQSKLNEERMISRSLKEESSKTKNNLQQELLSQRQQLEMHIAHMSEQHQQTVMALDRDLSQVAARLAEQEATNGQMTEEIVLLRERITVLDNQIAHYQQTHPATQDLMIQLEDSRNVRTILERDLSNSQFEVNRLNNELRSLTEQLNRKNAEIEKFNCIVTNMKIENEELLKENTRNNEQINLAYNEKAQLQMEYDELKKQLVEIREKSNSSEQLQEMESAAYQYQSLLNEKTQELYQLQEQFAQLESSNKDTQLRTAELDEQKKVIDELNDKLSKQLAKNEDLRHKNWKAMEALSNMEKTLESKMKGVPHSSHEIRLKEREELAKHVVKHLPYVCESSLKLPSSYEDNVWFSYLEKIFSELNRIKPTENESQFLASLEESIVPKDNNVPVLDELGKQNKQLQTMVSRYKRIISDTEGMLSSLQNHIEQEENRWSEQVRVLSEQVQVMSEKVQLLQAQLNSISDERNSLLDKVKNIQNGCAENDISEQKVNNRVNKCLPLMASSSINETVSS